MAVAGLVLVAVVLSACTPSQVDPAAQVTVRGEALRHDGTPADDLPVVLVRDLGAAEVLEGLSLVAFSVGTACLAPQPPDICRQRAVHGRIGTDGAFGFELTGRDTQSLLGFATPLAVTVTGPAPEEARRGASTTHRFQVHAEHTVLPPMRLWEAAVAVTADAQVGARWEPLADGLGSAASYQVVFLDSRGAPVWVETPAGTEVTVDARLLEDLDGGVAVSATSRLGGDAGQVSVEAMYEAPEARLVGPAGPPPSRGRPCAVLLPGGASKEQSPCLVTDGDMTNELGVELFRCDPDERDEEGRCPRHEAWLIVDLGETRPVSMVVIRADEATWTVEVGDDLASWRSAGTVHQTGFAAVLRPEEGLTARYVRLRPERGLLPTVREVSVW